ncbi:MAG TPA: hypothetical protein DCZ75_15755 [Geobacter sp.]|nr:hypothetical protein [Geobacter sp.]
MEYRLSKEQLFEALEQWNRRLKRKVHLIACGGTAMTLLGIKASTKDVDFIAPVVTEYNYLTRNLREMGYEKVTQSGWQRKGEIFQFDIFPGANIHTTGLLASPLEPGRHSLLKEYSHLYIGILNYYDLICSKLMRGTRVDFEDCLALAESRISEIDVDHLVEQYREMIRYDIAELRLAPHMDHFLELLRERGLYEPQ